MGRDRLQIRTATLEDHALVLRLFEELIAELDTGELQATIRQKLPEDIKSALESEHISVFLGSVQQEVVGVARADILSGNPVFRMREQTRCGYVDQMYVRRAFRKCGYGQQLLRHCEAWFREKGLDHALLHAAPNALHFYTRAGYQPNREYFKRL